MINTCINNGASLAHLFLYLAQIQMSYILICLLNIFHCGTNPKFQYLGGFDQIGMINSQIHHSSTVEFMYENVSLSSAIHFTHCQSAVAAIQILLSNKHTLLLNIYIVYWSILTLLLKCVCVKSEPTFQPREKSQFNKWKHFYDNICMNICNNVMLLGQLQMMASSSML